MTRSPRLWRLTAMLLGAGWSQLRSGGARLLGLLLVCQLAIIALASPVFGWLLREALRANGMFGLDPGVLPLRSGFPITIALIVVIVALAFWMLALQFTAIVVLLRWGKLRMSGRDFLRALARVARKLARPSSLPLLAYLFLLLPLTGFGFTSLLVQGIAIPPFITGELSKSVIGGIALLAVLLALAWVNLRFALTVPLFVLTDAAGGRALRTSWRLTKSPRTQLAVAFAIALAILAGAALGMAVVALALAPTALTDAIAPGASPAVAAYSLGIAQVAGLLIAGLVTAFAAAVLVSCLRIRARALPAAVRLAPAPTRTAPAPHRARRRETRVTAAVVVLAVVVSAGFGTVGIHTLQSLSAAPQTLVLAHRGFTGTEDTLGGVENTIGGLEAAAAAGADLVEMDVMQTKDGGFVVLHDANLSRLAGIDRVMKDMTLAELTATTVTDLQGNSDTIPSLADYVTRAGEIGMPLLIEIKLGGADTSDHVDLLVAELESLDALDRNIYHSLDSASVTRLKLLRPDLTVGYTMAFAAVGLPATPADMLVVEQWTATEEIQHAAEQSGMAFLAWTLNDELSIREHLRRDTHGIVTDHPELALRLREDIADSKGLVPVLLDALTRFVTVV